MTEDYWYLCCNCGEITRATRWPMFILDPETEERRPPQPDESDPVMVCPECEHEHVDDDSNPGLYDGTLSEMEKEREDLLFDRGSSWADHWIATWQYKYNQELEKNRGTVQA